MSHIRDGRAKLILRGEMARRGISYDDLVALLREAGSEETNASLRNKLSRGAFTADFFLQSLTAMKVANLRLDES